MHMNFEHRKDCKWRFSRSKLCQNHSCAMPHHRFVNTNKTIMNYAWMANDNEIVLHFAQKGAQWAFGTHIIVHCSRCFRIYSSSKRPQIRPSHRIASREREREKKACCLERWMGMLLLCTTTNCNAPPSQLKMKAPWPIDSMRISNSNQSSRCATNAFGKSIWHQ